MTSPPPPRPQGEAPPPGGRGGGGAPGGRTSGRGLRDELGFRTPRGVGAPAGHEPGRSRMRVRRRVVRTPVWWRDVVGVLCWGSVLVVVALWVSGRGVQSLGSGPGELITTMGRLAGLVAADLLLVQ